ncbi:hypothetical protein [Sorangium sp. So ce1389]|uniref:hypothetical protein n=1 Tax=Sorangium sp. So ce1389 TaxID=3133336 RepID=UPI003F604B75
MTLSTAAVAQHNSIADDGDGRAQRHEERCVITVCAQGQRFIANGVAGASNAPGYGANTSNESSRRTFVVGFRASIVDAVCEIVLVDLMLEPRPGLLSASGADGREVSALAGIAGSGGFGHI